MFAQFCHKAWFSISINLLDRFLNRKEYLIFVILFIFCKSPIFRENGAESGAVKMVGARLVAATEKSLFQLSKEIHPGIKFKKKKKKKKL